MSYRLVPAHMHIQLESTPAASNRAILGANAAASTPPHDPKLQYIARESICKSWCMPTKEQFIFGCVSVPCVPQSTAEYVDGDGPQRDNLLGPMGIHWLRPISIPANDRPKLLGSMRYGPSYTRLLWPISITPGDLWKPRWNKCGGPSRTRFLWPISMPQGDQTKLRWRKYQSSIHNR